MTPQADNSESLPQEHLDGEDVIALDCITYGYLCYLRRFVPASKKRDDEMKMLKELRCVLALTQREEVAMTAISLSNEYLEVLVDALELFTKRIRRHVPASAERDSKLARLEGLRRRLARMRAQRLN